MFLSWLLCKAQFLIQVCPKLIIDPLNPLAQTLIFFFYIDLAIVTALFQIGGTVASSVGSAIAGAIWNGMLPGQIATHVPGEYDPSLILGDINYINSLPRDQHDGAALAYGEVQRILSIVSVCLVLISLGFFFRMKPLGLTEEDQHAAADDSHEEFADEKHRDEESYTKA